MISWTSCKGRTDSIEYLSLSHFVHCAVVCGVYSVGIVKDYYEVGSGFGFGCRSFASMWSCLEECGGNYEQSRCGVRLTLDLLVEEERFADVLYFWDGTF